MTSSGIRFEGARKVYVGNDGREVVAVHGLDLEVPTGETHCLIGRSGCGKTTSMKMVNRLVEPTAGRVLVGGDDVSTVDATLLRRRIGYVIQSGGLFPHMDVGRNVGILCELEGWDRDRREARASELLELVGLSPGAFARRRPSELSGGQRQRVGVARALALDPEYVLMDEPFGALDPITRSQIHDEFEELQAEVRKTVVIVTHDLAEAFRLGDRISLMDAGRLVFTGTEDEMKASEDPFVRSFAAGSARTLV